MSDKSLTEIVHRDVFLCHASEDKKDVVEPLYNALIKEGVSCWYDEAEIKWGDTILEKINEGLRISRYVIVVFSPKFSEKNYPQFELHAALSQEASTGETKVLPLIYGTESERRAILKKFIVMSHKHCIPWTGNPQEIIMALRHRLSPDTTKLLNDQSHKSSPQYLVSSNEGSLTRFGARPFKGSAIILWAKKRIRLMVVALLVLLILGAVFVHDSSSRIQKESEDRLEHYLPEMRLVQGGVFLMGSSQEEISRLRNEYPEFEETFFDGEKPEHEVEVYPFSLSKNEVTNEQYRKFLLNNPDRGNVEDLGPPSNPVVQVSWFDALAYCQWLSEVTGKKYRLPTEAEWEKAAKGSTGRIFPWGNQKPNALYANFNQNPNVMSAKPVGSSLMGITPDSGLMNMAGNVAEWCSDWYGQEYYKDSQGAENPTGPAEGEKRVVRGGSWKDPLFSLRCAARSSYPPETRRDDLGFRIVKEP